MNLSTLLVDACERRGALHDDPEQTAYRLFHGYGEGCPGLTVDRYGDIAVIAHKVDVSSELDAVAEAVVSHAPVSRVVAKAHRYFHWHAEAISVTALRGNLPDGSTEVRDNGLRLLATVHTRQANGLFLDARPARAWLLENSAGRRILNLFAYSGSLGVAAAAGGARSVVHVDNKAGALELARRNHELNRLDADDRSFLRGNVYQHLRRARRAGLSFDGIILDPPPRVPDRMANRRPVGQDYPQLAPLVARLLAPGGWLLCFFHRFDRAREEFERDVLEHAGVPLDISWRGTSGEDFPESDPERKLRLAAFVRSHP